MTAAQRPGDESTEHRPAAVVDVDSTNNDRPKPRSRFARAARERWSMRAGSAATAVILGALLALLGCRGAADSSWLMFGTSEIVDTPDGHQIAWFTGSETHALDDLVFHDLKWTAAAIALTAAPLWFWWWRRSAVAHGRALGLMISLAGVATVCACTLGKAWMSDLVVIAPGAAGWRCLTLAGVAFAIGFVVAPPPRDPEHVDDLAVRALVRRHRKSHVEA